MIGASLFMVLQTESQPSPYYDPLPASSFCLFGYFSPSVVSPLLIAAFTWMNYRCQVGTNSYPRSANIRSISRSDLASRSIRYSCRAEYYFPYSHGIAELRHRGLHFISHMKQFSYLPEGRTNIDSITI
jgi:hypothetical protein